MHTRVRSIVAVGTTAAIAAGLACALCPVHMRVHRAVMIVAVLVAWMLCIVKLWRWRYAAYAVTAAGAGMVMLFCAPGRAFDKERLRARYAAALQRYGGTMYVWGGETRLGIDCSGLVREGLVDACLAQGAATLNPRLIRFAATVWWNDCAARELIAGYRGMTIPAGQAPSLNAVAASNSVPGLLAVTANGIHVLACIGSNQWIQADPGAGKVISVDLPSSNDWCTLPVRFVQWSVL